MDFGTGRQHADFAFRVGAVFGLTGVALGAFGAHGLAGVLQANDTVAVWNTAVFYQMVHAVALLALGAAGRSRLSVCVLWAIGVIVFSGTLYALSISGVRWLGAITPVGGIALILGWIILVVRGRRV